MEQVAKIEEIEDEPVVPVVLTLKLAYKSKFTQKSKKSHSSKINKKLLFVSTIAWFVNPISLYISRPVPRAIRIRAWYIGIINPPIHDEGN